jgi:hypothetical protein
VAFMSVKKILFVPVPLKVPLINPVPALRLKPDGRLPVPKLVGLFAAVI